MPGWHRRRDGLDLVGGLPGSSGGLPGWDFHPLIVRPLAGHTYTCSLGIPPLIAAVVPNACRLTPSCRRASALGAGPPRRPGPALLSCRPTSRPVPGVTT